MAAAASTPTAAAGAGRLSRGRRRAHRSAPTGRKLAGRLAACALHWTIAGLADAAAEQTSPAGARSRAWTASATAWRTPFPWPATARGRDSPDEHGRLPLRGDHGRRAARRRRDELAAARSTAPRPSAASAWAAARAAICGHAGAEILAAAAACRSSRSAGCAGQAPVKPLPMRNARRRDDRERGRRPDRARRRAHGAATAFFLRRRGRSVILLERDLVGQQASGTNFGNVRRQGRFLPQLPLANRARELWGRLKELIGEDVEFLPTGHIRVACTPEGGRAHGGLCRRRAAPTASISS